jgi:N-acetylneuraminate synthase
VKALLNEANVRLSSEFEVEYSHHYSMERFREVGAVIINCVNRNYCKKIIVQLPGQTHPSHFHRRKEETFQVLHGILEVELDDRRKTLHPGDTCLVQPGVWHSFWSETGVVFEEISTRHYNDDSFYRDKALNAMPREQRKTVVDNWGRWQVLDKAGGLNW